MRIPFKSTNTIQQLPKPKIINNIQEQDISGIYKLTCNTRKLSYIGQTSRSLKKRYPEHIRYIKHNDPQSVHALHVLSNNHENGPINNTMTLLTQFKKNNELLIPFEQLYIQSHYHRQQLIQEQNTGEHNPICQLILDLHITSPPTKPTDQYFGVNTT